MAEQINEIKKEDLIQDDQFLNDASEFLLQRTGSFYTEPEEVFENYLSHMRWHSTNDVTPVRDLMFAQRAEPEMKNRMARLFQTYDALESNANDDISELAKDYGFSVLSSPSTWLGFITAGAGKVASLGAQQAARTGIRGLLYNVGKATAKSPIASGAIAGGTVEGTAGYIQEKSRQKGRVEVGAQEEENDVAIATNTLLQGAFGTVGGGLTGFIKKRQVAKAGELETLAKQATAENKKLAAKTADKVINKNKDVEKVLQTKLRPLDPKVVEGGRGAKKEKLSENEMLMVSFDLETKKAITAAAIDLLGPTGKKILAQDENARVTEIVANRIRDKQLSTKEIDQIGDKYNLTKEQIGLIFTADISDAARSLQMAGQIKKAMLRGLVEDVQKLSDTKTGQGIALTDEQVGFIADIPEIMSALAKETGGAVSGFERMRRAILTSQPQTTVRNFAGGAARIIIDAPETLFENAIRNIVNFFAGKKVYQADEFRSDSLSILKFMNPILPTKENRVVADVVANMYAAGNPASAQRLFGTFIDSADVAHKGAIGNVLQGIGGALNFANRFSDNYFKKAIFTGELNRLVKGSEINGKTGRDLLQIVGDGDFARIDNKLLNKATEKAFELLYQKTPSSQTRMGRLGRAYLDFDKHPVSGVAMGMLIPFPRFIMNQIEFAYDHAPIIGLIGMNKTNAPEKIAKQISGVGMIAIGYQLRASQGEGTQWYQYVDETGDKTDLRPFLGPLSLPLYLGDLLYRHYDSTATQADNVKKIVDNAKAKTVSEIMLGTSMRVGAGGYFASEALPELTAWVTGVGEDTDYVSNMKFEKAMGRFAGDYVATLSYAMPIAVARDIYKITDAENRLINETNGQVTFGDIFRVRASRALPQPLKEKALNKLEREPITPYRYEITSDEPTETRDPFATAVTGLARSRPLNALEKELNRLGLTAYDLYKNMKFGPADVLMRRELSGNGDSQSLNSFLKSTLEGSVYADKDKVTQKGMLLFAARSHVAEIRNRVFDVLQFKARKGDIDYSVPEVMRIQFESLTKDKRNLAVAEFKNQVKRKPNLRNEKDLKLLIEIGKTFTKKVSGF